MSEFYLYFMIYYLTSYLNNFNQQFQTIEIQKCVQLTIKNTQTISNILYNQKLFEQFYKLK